ncbi:hypothetical protein B484DRAFT_408335 [Ochromonadaceae sp. CCMP2298]|nr:hypothetical protein B484DRAFT_408335 [Ochromonadaceae sp. CCMP2298]
MTDRKATLRQLTGPQDFRYHPEEVPTAVAREEKRNRVYEESLSKGSWHVLPMPMWCRNKEGNPVLRECSFFARYYCRPSHCNDFRNLRNRYTGEHGVANCEIVRGDGDDLWLVATRKITPGSRGYEETLTFYGDEWDVSAAAYSRGGAKRLAAANLAHLRLDSEGVSE